MSDTPTLSAAEYQAMMKAGVLTRGPNGRIVPAGDPRRDVEELIEEWRSGEWDGTNVYREPAEQEAALEEKVVRVTRRVDGPHVWHTVRGWLIGWLIGIAMMLYLAYELSKSGAFK